MPGARSCVPMRPIAPLFSLALTASTLEISAAWMLGAAARRPLVRTASRIATMAEAPPPRELTEENARAVLQECMEDLGTLFGSNAESLAVGITGAADFVDLEGPILVISLSGRFWHQRSMVVERVKKYVMDRIPECVDVEIVDVAQLDDTNPTDLEEKFAELDAVWASGEAAQWEEHLDDESGLPYYYNRSSGESVWEKPAALDAPAIITPAGTPSRGTESASFGNDGGRRPDQFG
jgi:hypothetical protein